MYQIERLGPSPTKDSGRYRYPVIDLEVGDSFLVEGDEKMYNSLRVMCFRARRDYGGRYVVRNWGKNKWRVWRLA